MKWLPVVVTVMVAMAASGCEAALGLDRSSSLESPDATCTPASRDASDATVDVRGEAVTAEGEDETSDATVDVRGEEVTADVENDTNDAGDATDVLDGEPDDGVDSGDATDGEPAPCVWASGLPCPVAYWPFEPSDLVGPYVLDHVGGLAGGRSGLSARAAKNRLTDGVAGNALTFPLAAPSGQVVIPTMAQDPLELLNAGTLSVWIRLDSLPSELDNYEAVLDKGGSGSDLTLLCGHYNQNTSSYDDVLWFSVGSASVVVTSTPLIKGNWYHVVGTFDSSTHQVCIYSDPYRDDAGGVASESDCVEYASPRPPDVMPFTIGNGPFYSPRLFAGTIDEVAVWAVALTPNQISQVHDLGASGKHLDLQ